MKILWISDNPNANSGYGKITAQTAQYLKAQGHEVMIMAGGVPMYNMPLKARCYYCQCRSAIF